MANFNDKITSTTGKKCRWHPKRAASGLDGDVFPVCSECLREEERDLCGLRDRFIDLEALPRDLLELPDDISAAIEDYNICKD